MVASHRRDEPVRRATFRVLSAVVVAGAGLGIALSINDQVGHDRAAPARTSDAASRSMPRLPMPTEFLLETATPSPAPTPSLTTPAPAATPATPATVASTTQGPFTNWRATPNKTTSAPVPAPTKPPTPTTPPPTLPPSPSPTLTPSPTPPPAPTQSPAPSPTQSVEPSPDPSASP